MIILKIFPHSFYHLQPIAQRDKSYIKGIDGFLRKIRDIQETILYTIDVVGLYPSIPHVSSKTLVELASLVLKKPTLSLMMRVRRLE